jgi:peroxiredoxin
MLIPGKTFPEFEVPMLGADTWRLVNAASENFTLLIVYRGLHCPLCKEQLEELNDKIEIFAEHGVKPFAVSMDSKERADQTFAEWKVRSVPLGYEMTREQADELGLFVSEGISESEPEIFAEPAMFLVRPNGELFATWAQSVPFARPTFDDLISGIEFILNKDYPPRGTETKR